jgi:integrase
MQRKKGDGSFRKLSNGSVEFTVSIDNDIYGKRQRKFFYGKTEADCRKKYKEFLKEGEKQPGKLKERTLSSWLDEWLPTYKQHKVEASTYADYVYLANHVKEHRIGGMKLTQVKPIHVTEYFASKSEYSHSFIKRSKFLLNAAFECAVDNEFCDRNPVRRAEVANKPQGEREAYTEDEARFIVQFAKTDELFGVPAYIMFNTGIRGGEMRALSVDRIDFENRIIKIDRAIKRTGEIGKPKNRKTRYIPLETEVAEFLRTKLQGISGYIIGGDSYTTHSGLRGRHDWFFTRLNLFLAEKGEKPIAMKTIHSSRHTFASIRQKNGMPVAILMEIMGHSSREMTDHYTHVGDVATLTEAVQKYAFLKPMAE